MSNYKCKILQKDIPEQKYWIIEKSTNKFCGGADTFEDAQWKAAWNAIEEEGDYVVVNVLAIANCDILQKVGDAKPAKHIYFRHYPAAAIHDIANSNGKSTVVEYLEDMLSRLLNRKKISDHVDELVRSPEKTDAIN